VESYPNPTGVLCSNPSIAPVISEEKKIRHEWYQTATHVFVSVFAKNVKKESAGVEIKEKSLSISIKLSETNDFQLHFDLCDKIIPEQSATEFLSTKVEFKLKKANQTKWKTLEDEGHAPTQWDSVATSQPIEPFGAKKKNWDKIIDEVVGTEKLEGDEGLNKVFQDIYSNGSDEQKRAMMKSFVESGGTVLSTNWEDVGKGKVKGSPPDGMEMHEWEELNKV